MKMSRIIGAIVGAEIDRRDGEGGVKGAALGAIAAGAVKRLGTLGLVLGGAYAAKRAYDRRREAKAA